MKKQFLFLTVLVLALFASMTNANAQAVHYSAPRPLSCTPDALHPIAGQPWTYEAQASVAGTFHFWATKDPDFISTVSGTRTLNTATALTTPTDLLAASANYNTPGATANVVITWSSAILANTDYQGTPDATGASPSPTFVAVYFASEDGCSDNFKVWELDPLNGFTVDVLAIDPDAVTTAPDYTVIPTSCVDQVESATYTAGAMVYNYGENYLYFEFVASNFTGYWVPYFALSGLNTTSNQAIVSYEYTYDLPSTWGASTTWTQFTSGNEQIQTSLTNTSGGVSVFVRVLVDHDNYENLAGQTLVMTLDGENAAGQWDVANGTGSDTCTDPGQDYNDTASSTLTPRPAITDPAMPTPNFIDGNEAN